MSSVGLVYTLEYVGKRQHRSLYSEKLSRASPYDVAINGEVYCIATDKYHHVLLGLSFSPTERIKYITVPFIQDKFTSVEEYEEWLNNQPLIYKGDFTRYSDVLVQCGVDNYWVASEHLVGDPFCNGIKVKNITTNYPVTDTYHVTCGFVTVILIVTGCSYDKRILVTPNCCDKYTNLFGNFQEVADMVTVFLKYTKFESVDGKLLIKTPMVDDVIDYDNVEYIPIPVQTKSARS